MSYEFFLAKRFLVGQRFGVFRTVTTAIAIGGTALGVAALLVTLAVMDGFRTDIQDKILGTQPHLVIVNPFGASLPQNSSLLPQVQQTPHIVAAAPYIYGQALLQSASSVTGIILRGIDFQQETRVTPLSSLLVAGRWDNLNNHSIVLGQELARVVSARVGDNVTLVVPQGPNVSWGMLPRLRQYKVTAIFHSGMYEYDANLAYLTLPASQDLFDLKNHITGYGIRLDNVENTAQVEQNLQKTLGMTYWVRSWEDLNHNLFFAMKLERTVMFIILTLIILVSSFTIISNMLLLTIEKAREIGILQAIGVSPYHIVRIFILHGFILGGSGVGLGLVLGTGISAFLKRYPLIHLPEDVYYVDKLPIHLSTGSIESVAACAFTLVLISIIYPAWKAGRMDPVQAIRQ